MGLCLVVACGDDEESTQIETAASESTSAVTPTAAEEGTIAEMACAQAIFIGHADAERGDDAITRTEADARERAEELRSRLEEGDDFAEVAQEESDGPRRGARGGLVGTWARDAWPVDHRAIRDAVFRLEVGQLSDVIETPWGFAMARRCPIEERRLERILIRHRDAQGAGDIARSRDAAAAIAVELRNAIANGASFGETARARSEAPGGGDIVSVYPGMLDPAVDDVFWALAPGEVSDVLESAEGFEIVRPAVE